VAKEASNTAAWQHGRKRRRWRNTEVARIVARLKSLGKVVDFGVKFSY
jgi:hypothetical protein